MAEEAVRNRQFEYKANSNLVLEVDRESRRRGAAEPTGEVESLWGKTRTMQMGDRVAKVRRPELEEKLKKSKEKRERRDAGEDAARQRSKRQKVFVAGKGASVLTETEDLDSINYRPKTRDSREAYESILGMVQTSLGDQPQDVLRGAAEEIIALLKDDLMRDMDRHAETQKLIGKVSPELFNKFVSFGKRITDFRAAGADDDATAAVGGGKGSSGVLGGDADDGRLDEEMGVAVVFDDEDEAEQESDNDEVRDSEDEDDDGLGGVEAREDRQLRGQDDGGDDDDADAGLLDVHAVDAQWLQRRLGKYYDDANVTKQLEGQVLEVLKPEREERECENALVRLLDFDKFELIKVLLQNRAKVYYCTRLKQAQTDEERADVVDEMSTDLAGGGPAILEALQRTESASSWNQDRTADFEKKTRKEARALNKGAGEAGRVMVVDEGEGGVAGPAAAGTGTGGAGVGGAAVAVDLDAMVFPEGGHFMANKRCELPAGAWRAQKKGYEEV
ncbi:unnamed protein product, partial [Phaeothamnion confervicola]